MYRWKSWRLGEEPQQAWKHSEKIVYNKTHAYCLWWKAKYDKYTNNALNFHQKHRPR